MTGLAADRFMASGGRWIDIATGAAVSLVITAVGSTAEQFAWSHQCETLANLRHAGLNPLVDFGLLDRERRFEAYARSGPVRLGRHSAAGLRNHLGQFLEAHGVRLSARAMSAAARSVAPGPAPANRWLGYRLCPRRAIDALIDTLDLAAPVGLARIAISGPERSGLRTVQLIAARLARLAGYIPVSAGVVASGTQVASLAVHRHLCVLAGPASTPAAALPALLASAGRSPARRHLLLDFTRADLCGSVRLEPIGVTAMTAMIHVSGTDGPGAEEIAGAARQSGGWPGTFLELLGGAWPEKPDPLVVRETAPAYSPAPLSARAIGRERRIAAMLQRARARGARLARDGRHAAATRVLQRAERLLSGRGHRDEAAQCAIAHAELLLDRGLATAAAERFDRARALAASGAVGVAAALGVGRACLLDGRLADAEGALRTVTLAAESTGAPRVRATASAVLAECLCRQGRAGEAELALGDGDGNLAEAECARVRVCLARGDIPGAVRAARKAERLARREGDARAIAAAADAAARACAAAGDSAAARAALAGGTAVARRARLSVARFTLRITAVALGFETRVPGASLLPALLRCDLAAALRPRHSTATVPVADTPSAELERLLVIAHSAEDDTAAVAQVCAAVLAELGARSVAVVGRPPDRRVLAVAGKGWDGEPSASRLFAGEPVVAADLAAQPCVAGVPVRCAGELVGALACRYAAGSAVHPSRTAGVLKAAALAMAPAVRAALERAPAVSHSACGELLGDSTCMHALRDAIARAARAPFPVLVQGESGSGKELVARAIHRLGARRDRRFCAVNCAALSDDLLEAELFGHARGAFTGAIGERAGLFEDADGGTLFLDEVGELSSRAQAKLLRVLQDGEVRRIGENVARKVDVRIVAATNRRLAEEVGAGRFRADLRFRLDVVRIEVPPLREHPDDVPALAVKFWCEASARVGSQATLAPDTLAALARYDWPGNVRELQNVIAWMAVHSPRRGRVGAAALPAHMAHAQAAVTGTFESAREEFERRLIRAALATANGQRGRAADALGVTRQGLAKMIRRLGLETKERRLPEPPL